MVFPLALLSDKKRTRLCRNDDFIQVDITFKERRHFCVKCYFPLLQRQLPSEAG